MAPAAAFFGWRMVSVAFLVDFIAVGFFFYSFGIYYPAIDAEFRGGSVWVAMGIAVSNLLSGVFAPFAGRALDVLSLRRVMLVGAAIVAAGFGLLSLVRELWQYYLVLGTFMDGFAMMVTTIPVVLPVLKAQNIDLIWFGVIAVMLTEAALISPPEGLNLYVIHAFRKPDAAGARGTIMDVWVGVTPFFLLMMLGIVLVIAFPGLATWLPETMRGR